MSHNITICKNLDTNYYIIIKKAIALSLFSFLQSRAHACELHTKTINGGSKPVISIEGYNGEIHQLGTEVLRWLKELGIASAKMEKKDPDTVEVTWGAPDET